MYYIPVFPGRAHVRSLGRGRGGGGGGDIQWLGNVLHTGIPRRAPSAHWVVVGGGGETYNG